MTFYLSSRDTNLQERQAQLTCNVTSMLDQKQEDWVWETERAIIGSKKY